MGAKTRVLFVCMGNICRSPAAEGIFQKLVHEAELDDRIDIDSAGTLGYHAGDPADPRMRRAAARRGYDLHTLARQITPRDLREFDHILVADHENLRNVRALDPTGATHPKIRIITDHHPDASIDHVPDPYYGGEAGFEAVLDMLEVSCAELLTQVSAELKAKE